MLELVNQQEVFEDALKELKEFFDLDLSLSQKLELRNFTVPSVIGDYFASKGCSRFTQIEHLEREAAARFLMNNFSLDSNEIIWTLNSGQPLFSRNPLAYHYLQHQQFEMFLF